MTKKHYEAIAAVFANRPWTDHDAETRVIIHDLCDVFTRFNPRFDRSQFLAACGLTIND